MLDKKETAPEVPVQEQPIIKVCKHCGNTCKGFIIRNIVPKYCYYCGKKLDYLSSK